MKVLCDYHHADLFESLRMLFEDRLKCDFYRQIGPEWHAAGFWDIYDHPDTISQYLGRNGFLEGNRALILLKEIILEPDANGTCIVPGIKHLKKHNCITLQAFKNTRFDIIISSTPAHFAKFEILRKTYQPHAKHIFQMGNMWPIPHSASNILNSTTVTPHRSLNHVRYHQEFDLNIFKPKSINNFRTILNMQHYMSEPASFRALEAELPQWQFKEHGAGNRHGPAEDVAEVMRETAFLYHVKHGGEGYGYNIHHAYACGKPVITKRSLFSGMTAAPLLISGETCIDIDNKSISEVKNMLLNAADNYQRLSDRAYEHFKSIVNFDAEFENIKTFISNLR